VETIQKVIVPSYVLVGASVNFERCYMVLQDRFWLKSHRQLEIKLVEHLLPMVNTESCDTCLPQLGDIKDEFINIAASGETPVLESVAAYMELQYGYK
jgi:hypothetical protein